MTFDELRSKHKSLTFNGFEYQQQQGSLNISFLFTLDPDITFRSEIILTNIPAERFLRVEKELPNLIFNLGMVEMLSYWKAVCPSQIIIEAGALTDEQINFWKNLLIKGLGEFFYTNKIDFTKPDLVAFSVIETSHLEERSDERSLAEVEGARDDNALLERDLILIGGGKDSVVTLDLIANSSREFNCLMLNPSEAALKITEVAGIKDPIIINRTIDPKLLELNVQGYLNGHTPFSAYLAFLGALVGVIYDYKNIIVSNESSSNEGNVTWLGQEINHQYSKSAEFETDFQKYAQKYLAPINYYSYLRQLNELQISEKFSKMEKYHKLFRSCNRGSKAGIWCGKCPKCVSTYLTLYPYLGEKTKEIFGQDLLSDESLIPLVKGLLRENDVVKPFECVATVDEIKTAILLGRKRAAADGQNIPVVLQIKI